MARVVDVQVGGSPAVGWAEFADGQTYELRRGEDFVQPPSLARRAAVSWALRRGMHAKTSVPDPDTLIVRFES